MRDARSRLLRWMLIAGATGVGGFAVVSTLFAWRFTTPPRHALAVRPETFLEAYENVTFPARDGVSLAGWFVPRRDTKRAVVLLHGNGATRTQMLARARFFHDHGYSALLYDARGHGESGDALVSFGWYETRDLLGAIDWLRARGFSEIGLLGVSQGGATIALAASDLHGIRWAVLEPYVIPSGSMIPNLLIHDHVAVEKFAFGVHVPFSEAWLIRWGAPQPGDTVVFRYPENPEVFFIKRLIGRPGDTVHVEAGRISVNGQAWSLDEIKDDKK